MIYNHLESASITLTALSPVFIGAGGSDINKKEYIYVRKGHMVHLLDFAKWVNWLNDENLLKDYQMFMLSEGMNLKQWLDRNGVRESDYKKFTAYSIYAGDAIDPDRAFKEIKPFVKNAFGKPYVPGSSIKGALRSAIVAKLVNMKGALDRAKLSEIENAAKQTLQNRWQVKNHLKKEAEQIENSVLRTLGLNERRPEDAVNDIFRGVQVSDSLPIEEKNLVLCGKIDVKTQNVMKKLPLYRECLKPGTQIEATLTLDNSVLNESGITFEFIRQALEEFKESYDSEFADFFSEPNTSEPLKPKGVPIVLGGGAGFPTKTLEYSTMPREAAVNNICEILHKQFDRHNHLTNKNRKQGLSPSTIKYTKCNGKLYQMGWCDLVIND